MCRFSSCRLFVELTTELTVVWLRPVIAHDSRGCISCGSANAQFYVDKLDSLVSWGHDSSNHHR